MKTTAPIVATYMDKITTAPPLCYSQLFMCSSLLNEFETLQIIYLKTNLYEISPTHIWMHVLGISIAIIVSPRFQPGFSSCCRLVWIDIGEIDLYQLQLLLLQ